MQHFEKGNSKLLNAWAFYDWANSVYALVISSTIFPLFFGQLFREKNIETIHFLGFEKSGETIISYLTAFGFLIISIVSPILSGVADYLGNKKFFMQLFCYLGSVSCMMLYFFSIENLYWSLTWYLLALIGYWGSLVFYNSYLPDIAYDNQVDKISAKGFSLGYIGSVVLLIINLIMVLGVSDDQKITMMRYSFLLVGLWWLGFSQYTYKYLPSLKTNKKIHFNIILKGIRELKIVGNKIKEIAVLKKYLRAFFIYSMGVQTVMIIAAYFGEKEVDWGGTSQRTTGLISSILVIQLVAVIGAMLTSKFSQKFGNIKVLLVINFLWVLICIDAYFIKTPTDFYIAAAFVGLVMGGVQSLSRSTYAKLIPNDVKDTTSFFSFYDVSEKIGIVIGMFAYGLITDITGKVQNAILFLLVFFVAGVLLLLPIRNVK